MPELNRRPDRPDPPDGRPADGGDAGDRADRAGDRSRVPGRGGAAESGRPTLREMFDAADKMAAQYEAGYRPPGHRAANGPLGGDRGGYRGGDRTERRQESHESELTGLRERAAADRAELRDQPSEGEPDAGPIQDGPSGSDDPDRRSDRDRTDDNAEPEEPADATGGGDRGGDGPNNPPPPDGPDDGRDSPDALAAAKARIAELEKELDAAKAENEAKDATIGRLQNTCTYLDRGREAAETKAAEQSARVDALTGTVGELRGEVGELTGKVSDQSTQIETLTGKLDDLGTMLGDALKQMKSPEQAKSDAPPHEPEQVDERAQRLDEASGDVRAEPAEDPMLAQVESRVPDADARSTNRHLPTTGYGKLYASAVGSAIATGSAASAVMSFAADVPTHITPLAAAGGITGSAAGVGGAVMAVWATVNKVKQWRKGRDGD